MDNETSNTSFLSNDSYFVSQTQRLATMPVLIIFAIPALICFVVIFYYFIKFRKPLLFDRINHHVILLILISDFLLIATELPFSLYYLALGHVGTTKICTLWVYWDYILETASLFLTMYASIERCLLVFHKQIFLKQKVLFHYIPMTCAALYIPALYLYLIVLSPCVQDYQYDLTAFACGGACFFSDIPVNTYDTIVDTMLPCFTLLIFNLLMICRVIIFKRKIATSASVSNTLKKNRRMILQLLGISLMCLTAWMPWVVITIAQDFYDPSFGTRFITYILHYLPYLTTSVSPFLALIGLPEIRQRLKIAKKQPTITANATVSIAVATAASVVVKNKGLAASTIELSVT